MEPETTTETQSSGMNSLFDDLVPLSSSSPKPVVKPPEVKASPARPNTNTVMSLFNNAQKNNKPAAGTPGNSNSAVPSVFNNLFKKNFNTPTNVSQASKPNFSVCCSWSIQLLLIVNNCDLSTALWFSLFLSMLFFILFTNNT